MRIRQLAELTGTTVRAVRYYHSVGLLDVPQARGAWRDYTLEHVARVGRIRWLLGAGLSLSAIREVLDAAPANVVDDLRSTLSGIDEQILELQEQRRRLRVLLDASEQGHTLTPMPDAVVAHYAHMEANAPDERTARAIRGERDFVELACYRGEMPEGAELIFAHLDPATTAEALAAYGRDPDAMDDEQIEEAAGRVIARMVTALGERTDTMARELTVGDIDKVYDLFGATSSRGQKKLGEAVRRHLKAALSERQASSEVGAR
ncbi:MAG: MerR family transcriptional regulator [Propionibacteriaceae bacterium]|nr:MerR family transcriptional regulator [Propionibacteriaceae bacterium]